MPRPQNIEILLTEDTPRGTRITAYGGLVVTGDALKFARNVIFSSPSAASSVVLGRNSNGWVMWKDQQGRTIDQLHRQPV
jgi:hypothetical protein